jgi:hypothetical protein
VDVPLASIREVKTSVSLPQSTKCLHIKSYCQLGVFLWRRHSTAIRAILEKGLVYGSFKRKSTAWNLCYRNTPFTSEEVRVTKWIYVGIRIQLPAESLPMDKLGSLGYGWPVVAAPNPDLLQYQYQCRFRSVNLSWINSIQVNRRQHCQASFPPHPRQLGRL